MEKPMNTPALEALMTRLGGDRFSFPHPVGNLKVLQTHLSVVLLTGEFAYKIKKPVLFPFADYSTLKKRQEFCQLEVDLNQKLSEKVYLGVVPITRQDRLLNMEGEGPPVEYAVKMRRLSDDNRLGTFLKKGSLPPGFWVKLAARLTRFYREAARGPGISRWASFLSLKEDRDQILNQLRSFPPEILESGELEKIWNLTMENLIRHQSLIEKRSLKAREGHGDLRLEHIYYFPGEPEPEDLSIIDCVEFNPRYRCCDPLMDAAFLVMDLESSGYSRDARIFTREFLKTSGDYDGHLILDFYVAYRHLVRGLVRGLQAQEEDAAPYEKERACAKARAHFHEALFKLEKPGARPCLVLLGGLPGAGKSTLSHQLVQRENFRVLSSDMIRKEITDHPLESKPGRGFEKGIYKPEWTDKTYGTLLLRAQADLQAGHRVLVDASFWRQSVREDFQKLAQDLKVPFLFFVCLINHETAEKRLSQTRQYGSDADLEIFRKMAGRWEPPTPALGTLFLNTERDMEVNLSEIHRVLGDKGLAAEPERDPPKRQERIANSKG